jgi:hypothetical protein
MFDRFVCTTKNSPVHVRSAVDGRISATYNCIDDVDEVRAATSVAFSPDGKSLYAGMRGEFRCFDVERPGRDCFRKKLKSSCQFFFRWIFFFSVRARKF